MILFLRAIFLLIGSTIGAGIFALPYVFSRSGFWPSLLGTLFIGAMMIVLNIFYAKVIIATDGDHQLPGYVKRYLGSTASKISLLAMLVSVNGALLAYVILGGEFLALALGQLANPFYRLIFYLLRVALFYQGFKKILKMESYMVSILIALIISLPLGLAPFIQKVSFVPVGLQPFMFWGATIFALTSFSGVPEVEEALRKKHNFLIPVIITGGLISIILTFIFSFSVWGAGGIMTTADSLSGLIIFSPSLVRFGAIVGVLAMIIAFLNLANVAKEIYYRDLKLKKEVSKFLAILPCFLGVFFTMSGFIKIISYTGAIGLAISGVMISAMIVKLKKNYRFLVWPIAVAFVLGAIVEFF